MLAHLKTGKKRSGVKGVNPSGQPDRFSPVFLRLPLGKISKRQSRKNSANFSRYVFGNKPLRGTPFSVREKSVINEPKTVFLDKKHRFWQKTFCFRGGGNPFSVKKISANFLGKSYFLKVWLQTLPQVERHNISLLREALLKKKRLKKGTLFPLGDPPP